MGFGVVDPMKSNLKSILVRFINNVLHQLAQDWCHCASSVYKILPSSETERGTAKVADERAD
jgi:hypothetical protein